MALLVLVTMVSLGALTATAGVVVEESIAAADTERVAGQLSDAVEPTAVAGVTRSRVSFADGRLRTVERTVRVLNESDVVEARVVDGLVYEGEGRQVRAVAGAVVVGTDRPRLYRHPPITVGEQSLVVGIPVLGVEANTVGAGSEPTTVEVRTNATHTRIPLGTGRHRVAVETSTPSAWEAFFDERGATTRREDFDGDGVESVVARFPRAKTTYVVVHEMRMEVERD
ncbi:MAG: DUF7289 family protein [Halobacteriota archaeon]